MSPKNSRDVLLLLLLAGVSQLNYTDKELATISHLTLTILRTHTQNKKEKEKEKEKVRLMSLHKCNGGNRQLKVRKRNPPPTYKLFFLKKRGRKVKRAHKS